MTSPPPVRAGARGNQDLYGMREKSEYRWRPRPFESGDDGRIGELYRNVHDGAFDGKGWRWQFAEAVSRGGYIYLADDNGVLAGQYATIPVRMNVSGRRINGALSLDTMTHPGYRKQGIFVTLAKKVYEDTRSGGVSIVYGFPNDNSFHGFIKHLDFFVLDEIPTWIRPVSIPGFLLAKLGNRISASSVGKPLQVLFDLVFRPGGAGGGVEVRSEPVFPPSMDGLYEKASPLIGNHVIRDWKYLRWRYDDNPRHSYKRFFAYRSDEPTGYCVCGKTERDGIKIGLVVDILASPDDRASVSSLLRAALSWFREEGMLLASCLLPKGSPFLKTLKRAGFLVPKRPFPYIVRINDDSLDRKEIAEGRRWHITFGDGDFV